MTVKVIGVSLATLIRIADRVYAERGSVTFYTDRTGECKHADYGRCYFTLLIDTTLYVRVIEDKSRMTPHELANTIIKFVTGCVEELTRADR